MNEGEIIYISDIAIYQLDNNNIPLYCDSISYLDLEIYNTDSTFSSITACDEFVWDGISYNESGTYTNLYQNAIDRQYTYIKSNYQSNLWR